MDLYVGIDIGTSSAKLTLIDSNGHVVGESCREYRIDEPQPGWKEIDPDIWMKATEEAMKELIRSADSGKIKGIGVTGQMHTVVFIGKDGKSIRPALMWNDTRTSDMIPRLKDKIRKTTESSYLANVISTGSPAVNLLWLKETEPDHFKKIKKFLIGPDYIVYRLTGTFQTDYCEASTSSMLDLQKGVWSSEMRDLLGFSADIYPEVRGSGQIAGRVTEEWCDKFGFSEDVQVIVGTGDNPAAAISTGCFTEEYPVLSLGTSGVLMYPRKELDLSAKGKNILFSFDQKKMQILVQGVVQSCGSSMNWWVRDVLESGDFGKEAAAPKESLGKNELLFFPHLVGEKTIYADPSLRGAFVGIGTETSRADMTIAVMEGIAFGVRQLTEVMKIPKEKLENLPITGGGSKNPTWMQIFSEVLNVRTSQLESGTGAGYGMALTAASEIGDVPMEELIADTAKIKATFDPHTEIVERYEKKYQKYLKLHKALTAVFE